MSGQFDWQVGENEHDELPEEVIVASSRVVSPFLFVVGTAVILALLIGSWQTGQRQLAQSETVLQSKVQALLDFQHEAFLRGDGELFFAGYFPDPAFQTAQLLPYNLAAHRAGLQATRVRQRDELVWVNATWEAEGETTQRILFFAQQSNGLTQVASDQAYWGDLIVRKLDWGTLRFYEVDREWATELETAVTHTIAALCTECTQPLTVTITDHYGETAVSDQIQIPSPRLIALDKNGDPAPLFWLTLEQKIADRLTPAVIKFVTIPPDGHNKQPLLDYEQVATEFMALNPNITIELTLMDGMPDDPTTLATEFDGAAIVPTEDMLTAGLIFDLSDYAKTDPDFNQADFYEQIWQGALWQKRIWIVPQAAKMRVLFYDNKAYREAGLSPPSLRWTWDEMAQDISQLVPEAEQSFVEWGYLDTGLDSLYSYAYNWSNQCTQSVTILCQTPLRTQNVAAALEWYRQMVVQDELMPDLIFQLPQLLGEVSMTYFVEQEGASDRSEFLLQNFQSSRRRAAIWVDVPVNFERQFLLASSGIVPFPGSDRFDGITPLHVEGSFISQESKRPFAVWQWIKFLSEQRPSSRFIPARPTVANRIGFWRTLPQPLGDVMRTAFPFARPIMIEEQTTINWEQITAVISAELTPNQAANQQNNVVWFK